MSTLTIDLDNATEQNLSRISAKEGSAIEKVAAHLLARAARSDRTLSPQEIALMRTAREELPEARWKQYRRLIRKRRAENITPQEYAELLELGNQIEAYHAERLKAVFELSQWWGCGFEETVKLLGVEPRHS